MGSDERPAGPGPSIQRTPPADNRTAAQCCPRRWMMANDQLGIASSQNRSFKRRIRINGAQKRARGSKSELRSCIMRFRYTVLPLPTYTYTRELLLPRLLSAGRIAKPQDENLVPCIGRHYSQFIQFSVMLPMHVNFRHKNSVGLSRFANKTPVFYIHNIASRSTVGLFTCHIWTHRSSYNSRTSNRYLWNLAP